ncbi:MAG TPA: ABC transporter transmembrane domain-containing protein, partial [Geobacterales bacterium]|nr:ABC transporter transmembrane domain-containing protein [Geobacterales bacterium]
MRNQHQSYLAGFFFLLATNGFALLIPWLLKLAIESLRHPLPLHPPLFYGLAIICAAIAHGVIRIFSRTSFLHAARRIEFQIREELYHRLLLLDQRFYGQQRTGDLLSRFANDLTNIRMLLGFGLLNLLNTLILYTAALTLMISISPPLTLLALAPLPLMILLIERLGRRIFHFSRQVQEELAGLSNLAEENISAQELVRTFCRQGYQSDLFRKASLRYEQANIAMARQRGLLIPVMGLTGGLCTLITLFVGGGWIIAGRISLGDFVAFSGYLAMLIWPTVVMGWIFNLLQRGAASLERIDHILAAEPAVHEPATPQLMPPIRGGIELRH